MASIATHVRPAVGLAFLALVAALPWREHDDPRPACRPDRLGLVRPLPFATPPGAVIAPPAHPDARPWPYGMVIAPPDVDPAFVIAPDPGEWYASQLVDTILSAFIAPLRALGA